MPNPAIAGQVVTIKGGGFGNDINKIKVLMYSSYNVEPVSIIPLTVNEREITFKIPDTVLTVPSNGDFHIEVRKNGQPDNKSGELTVRKEEPEQGWYYANYMDAPIDYNASAIRFPTDKLGFFKLRKTNFRTTDGGITWSICGEGTNFPTTEEAIYFYNAQYGWREWAHQLEYTSDSGKTWQVATLSSIPDSLQAINLGFYMESPIKGQIAKSNGVLYYANGGFSATDLILEYKSSYFHNNLNWVRISNLDAYNLIIAGYGEFNGVYKPVIAHKKDGIFKEYIINNLPSTLRFKNVQLLTKNIAFFTSTESNLYKLTSDTTWDIQSQQADAVHFLTPMVGYISYKEAILKTTDGGNTWQQVFTMHTGDHVNSIASLSSGALWFAGNNNKGAFILKFKP